MNRKLGRALVVGAGIGGVRAALDLASSGYGVTLIDRQPHMGGLLSQLDYQFPTNHCGMCRMLPLVERDAASQFCLRKGLFHENIELLLSTEISAVEGEPGRFSVSLRSRPTGVDPRRCIGCGLCETVCPVEVADDFNAGLGVRKAIHLPVPHQIPNAYVIDATRCSRCGACVDICPTGAVDLQEGRRRAFRVLVVDDERIVRDSLREWLKEEGFTAETAESGPAALERLSQAPFDLMLADIKMPGMGGMEVLEKALAEHPSLTVIMMTAYATVETAVEAMKVGALDYLVKPFDPEALIPMVVRVFEDRQSESDRRLEVGAIVWCGGTEAFDPSAEKNVFCHGEHPNVLTAMAFERLLSGTGPTGGRILRRDDGRPAQKIAWLQCVGSRDLQRSADFCSSICCMVAVKEAVVARERAGDALEAAIFYMDMRTFGKSFQRYRDRAEGDGGVRFVRTRVHSVATGPSGDPLLRYVMPDGACREESFDMVVLATGRRPAAGADRMMEMLGIEDNPWGFPKTEPFAPVHTANPGVFAGGSTAGPADIAESVLRASAAACAASRRLRSEGGALAPEASEDEPWRDVSREPPRTLLVLCPCGRENDPLVDVRGLQGRFGSSPRIAETAVVERLCTAEGWERLEAVAEASDANRIVIGACLPYLFLGRLRRLGRRVGLNPALMDVVDLASLSLRHRTAEGSITGGDRPAEAASAEVLDAQRAVVDMAISRLRGADPEPAPTVEVVQSALVVGGGAAGMRAALSIADHGYPVHLVERSERLGGNLRWLQRTLEGPDPGRLLTELETKVERHPHIEIHRETCVSGAWGRVGRFSTTLTGAEGAVRTVEHGVVVLATGGEEARTRAYGCGDADAVVTQETLERSLADGTLDPETLSAVAMIQCVESREEPRNYCSRVCCASALKNALYLKGRNPRVDVYVFYRDMMSIGFSEARYTEARQAGVIFIPYDPKEKPVVRAPSEAAPRAVVEAADPILNRKVAIEVDRVVLATGVVPRMPPDLAAAFGAETDADGFFDEADAKWRPVDACREGVFCCGLALSPRGIAESLVTAEAAAARCLRILERKRLATGRIVAEVRHSLCSLCRKCIGDCPYDARRLSEDGLRIEVHPAMCQGCGSCAAVCPNGAAVVIGARRGQFFGTIDAALGDLSIRPPVVGSAAE